MQNQAVNPPTASRIEALNSVCQAIEALRQQDNEKAAQFLEAARQSLESAGEDFLTPEPFLESDKNAPGEEPGACLQ